MVSIKYDATVKNDKDRYAYLYRLQELLRLDHNEKGTDFREGKLSQEGWDKYREENFNPKSMLISKEINKYRTEEFNPDTEAKSEKISKQKELWKQDTKNVAKLSDIIE